MKLEWSAAALADLNRFAAFLHERHPNLAKIVAAEIVEKAQVLTAHPQLGRSIERREENRELSLQILSATYVFRYGYDGQRLVILRVFHSREERK